MVTAVPLTGYRNTPFPPEVFTFRNGGVPQNFTGKAFAMDVRAVAGTGPALISLDTAADDAMNGVRPVEATAGKLRFQIDQTTMQTAYDAAGVKAGAPALFVYDLLVIDADGFPDALIEGSFTIEPGVTL